MFFDLVDNKEKIYKKKILNNNIDNSKDNINKTNHYSKNSFKFKTNYIDNNIQNLKHIKTENKNEIKIKKIVFEKTKQNEKDFKFNNIISDEPNPKHKNLKLNDNSITNIKILDIKKNINKNSIINSTEVIEPKYKTLNNAETKIKRKVSNFILYNFNYKKNKKIQRLKKKEKEIELKNKFNLMTSEFKKQNLNILPIDEQFVKISHVPKNNNNIILSKIFNIIFSYYLNHYFLYFIKSLKKIKEKKNVSKENIIKKQTKDINYLNLKIIKNNEFNIFSSELNKETNNSDINLLFKCFGDVGKNLSGIKTFPRPYIELQNNKATLFKIFKKKINNEELKIQNNNNISYFKEDNIDNKNKSDTHLFELSKMFNKYLLKEDELMNIVN